MTKNEALKIKHISQYCEEIGKDCDNCLFQDCFSKAEIKIAKSILGDWGEKEIYYLEEACRQGGVTKEEAVKNWNRRATPENKPLTLEQLKRMDREPVWIQGSDTETSGWSIFKGNSQKQIANCPDDWNISYYLKDYGKTWIAYPRKMEQEATL